MRTGCKSSALEYLYLEDNIVEIIGTCCIQLYKQPKKIIFQENKILTNRLVPSREGRQIWYVPDDHDAIDITIFTYTN